MASTSNHRRRTKAAYDAGAAGWKAKGKPRRVDLAQQLGRAAKGRPVLDLGCGPGWHLEALGRRAIGLDLSLAMLHEAEVHRPVVQGDFMHLPLATGSIAGVWASRSLVHLARTEMPLALAELHRVLEPEGRAVIWLFEGDAERVVHDDDSLPGRSFSYWPREHLRRVFVGAGFKVTKVEAWTPPGHSGQLVTTARREWTLPDHVAPGLRLLICGLNPSPASADAGVGFYRAGNRFWPAALQAGIVSRDREPLHALQHHRIGMTDIVKRATRQASDLDPVEFRAGMKRVGALVEWLQPEVVCMVGLAGWRAAVDRKAERGWQQEALGGRPVYVMPSTSGLNAHDTVDTLAAHLQAAAAGR